MNTKFEHAVRESLKQQRLTQEKLANQVGFTQSYINKFLNGQRDGSVQFVVRLSDITGVPLEFLKESA